MTCSIDNLAIVYTLCNNVKVGHTLVPSTLLSPEGKIKPYTNECRPMHYFCLDLFCSGQSTILGQEYFSGVRRNKSEVIKK
jgi:hypothetical protein